MIFQRLLSPRRVVARHNLPVHLPLIDSIAIFLLLDRFQPAMWIVALAWGLVVVLWAVYVVRSLRDTEINVV